METRDVLSYITAELHDVRETAAAVLDRAEALAELLQYADARAGELSQTVLLVEDLHDPFAPEKTRARVASLVTRAFPPTPTHEVPTT